MDSTKEWSRKFRSVWDVDLEKNAKDILDRVQNQWWSTATCRRTKDTDDNTETKTEKMVGISIHPSTHLSTMSTSCCDGLNFTHSIYHCLGLRALLALWQCATDCLDSQPVSCRHHGQLWLLDAWLVHPWTTSPWWVHSSMVRVWPRCHVCTVLDSQLFLCTSICDHLFLPLLVLH